MRWFWCSVILCCVYLTPSFSQLKVSDRGQHVTAIIDPNNQGLITIRRYPGTNLDPILSYPQKSFVYIMINGKIFTNNHTGSNISGDPRFGGFLDNGVSTKTADTIRTTWPDKSGCDIIQEVYPVTFEASGQIVMRWKIKNKSATDAFWGEAQFLFDIQVGAQNPNDGAPILTRHGYRPVWDKYKADSASGLSWFFASFERQLPNAPSFTPGTTGVGYNQDGNYKLGLKKPSRMTIGDWGSPLGTAALVDFLWGVSTAAPWGTTYTDAAIQYQWEGGWVPAGSTTEVASTSYGTGEFTTCTGQLYGIVFYPRHFKWKSTEYDPDTANIEFYAFDVYSPHPQDPNFGPPSEETHLKLHVGPNLRIISPDTMLSPNQKIQLQQTAPNGLIPQYGVGTAMWKVVPEKINIGKDKIASWLKFTAQSSLAGNIFFNSGDGDTCEHQVLIDCNANDTNPPAISDIDSFFSVKYLKHFSAFENRPNDLLIKSVSWSPSSRFDVTVLPLHWLPCTEDTLRILVAQMDSAVGGCVNIIITDCADNDTTIKVCFQKRPIDLIAPEIQESETLELIGNPASASTTLRITLVTEQSIKLSILDISGRVVITRPATFIPAGVTDVQIPLDELGAGTYYIVAEWDGMQYAKKLSVIK